MNKQLICYDRSRVVKDWTCPRARFWAYEYGGTGITGSNTHLELFLGTTLHDGLAAIATSHLVSQASSIRKPNEEKVDIDLIASTAQKQVMEQLLLQTNGEVGEVNFAAEQASLIEGLLRGFFRHCWPRLLAEYPIIKCIEGEMKFEHDGLTFMSRPDLVLANNDGLVYVEFKSTSSKNENWVNSWDTAVQLHSTIRAIETTLGETVSHVIVQGLYKGYSAYSRQNSPMCYAYVRQGSPPFSQTQVRYDYAAGFKRQPVWEQEGGVKKWVEEMPEDILADQFPRTAPIFVKSGMVSNFFKQRAVREHEIARANEVLAVVGKEITEEVLNEVFPQKFESCHPWISRPCQFLNLCHGNTENPLETGNWVPRIPHHILELELFNGNKTA